LAIPSGGQHDTGHLPETLDSVEAMCKVAGIDNDINEKTKFTADSGYHSEDGLAKIDEKQIDAYIG
jgi:hypothetical protein